MNPQGIKCSMCGHSYDPDQHLACQSCPMHSGCSLVCCPNCGYQTVDPRKSKLVRLARFFSERRSPAGYSIDQNSQLTLADVPPGCKAKVVRFAADFPPDRRAYLQSYGLVMDYWVQVVQHSPITIVRLDHLELALENELASGIIVQMSPDDLVGGALD
jgi:Fe2+ transport system protein FeoA